MLQRLAAYIWRLNALEQKDQVILSYYGTPDETAFHRVRSALRKALDAELEVYHMA